MHLSIHLHDRAGTFASRILEYLGMSALCKYGHISLSTIT